MVILVIEDNLGLSELIKDKLQEHGHEVNQAQTAKDSIEYFEKKSADLIVLDYGLPDMNGIELLNKLDQLEIIVPPFIVSTGIGDEKIAVDMMKLGARDYIVKDNNFLVLLPSVIKRVCKEIDNQNKRKLAEAALRESEIKYRNLVENSIQGVVIAQMNPLRISFANSAMKELTGYEVSDLLLMKPVNLAELIYPDDRKRFFQNFQFRISDKKIAQYDEYRIKCYNGELKWVQTNSNKINYQGEAGTLTTFIDITNRKKAERALIESEAHIRSIFKAAPIGIGVVENRVIKHVNQKMCNITGYSLNELVGKSAEILYNSKEDFEYVGKEKYKQIEEKGTGTVETKWICKDGRIIDILLSSTPMDANDPLKGITFTALDITNRKKTEEEIIKAKEQAEESDRLKTEFINNMSHEIRTPMNGILGFANLLDNPDLSEEKHKTYTKLIKNNGNQLLRIINDILEISKLGTKQVQASEKEVCLNDILLEQFAFFDVKAKENKIPLYFQKGLSDKESTIYTDETKLSKILSNLLDNAFKFTNNGSIELGYQLKDKKIELYVKDSGIGINPEKQELIFKRFSRVDKSSSQQVGGLGLGLSIAKENAELIGAEITLKSELNKGSVFYLTMPYCPVYEKLETTSISKKEVSETNGKYTILIVEDEEVNYLYIETLIKDEIELKSNILHAKNGEEAIEICKLRSEIDIVLMDIKMPVLNGYEATKKIKKIRPNLTVIAQTAYSVIEDKKKAISAGCDNFISKPIDTKDLADVLGIYLKLNVNDKKD